MINKIMKLLPSTIVPLLCGFLVTFINTNTLSISENGKLSIYTNLITFTSTIFFSFMIQSFLRYYYEYSMRNEFSIYINKFITYFNIVFLGSILLVILGGYILNYNIKIGILILFNSFFLNIFSIQLNEFRCSESFGKYNKFKIINSILKIIFLITLYKISNTSITYLYGTLFSFILICGKFYLKNIKFVFDKDLLFKSIRYGFPLVGTSLGYLILSSADRYMIMFIKGDVEVGYYSFAYQLSELSLININTLLMIIFYPLIIKSYDKKGRVYTEVIIGKLLNYHFFIILPITIMLILFSKDLTCIFFKQYIGTEKYIVLVAIGVFIYCTSFYTNKIFELKKVTKKLLLITIVAAVLNLILNLIFIPKYGAIAAAITTIISYLIYIILSINIGKNFLNIRVNLKNIFKIIFNNILILLVGIGLNNVIERSIGTFILKVIIIVFIYLLGTYISRVDIYEEKTIK